MSRYYPHIALALFFLVIQALLYRISAQVPYGELADPDGYMRLLRVEHLLSSGHWFDQTVPESNAPHGESSQWSRPLDVLLILGALPLWPFLGLKNALFWWGVWFSPVVQMFSVVALAWAGAVLFKPASRMHLSLFFLCQPALIDYYCAGRPDHHSLLMFCFIIITGQMLRILTRPPSNRLLICAGLMQAFMLWISIEALTVCLLTQLALGLAWVVRRPDAARQNLLVSFALTCGVCVALLVETPEHLLRFDVYDRLCGLNLAMFSAQTLFWFVMARLEKNPRRIASWLQRLLAGAAGAVVCLVVIYILSPRFFHGPYANVDPRLAQLWLKNVREVAPLAASASALLPQTLTWLGSIFLVVPFLFFDFKNRIKDSAQLCIGVYFAFGIALFVVLTLAQIRWATYAELILIFPLTELLSRVLDWLETRISPKWFSPARTLLVMFFAAAYLPFVLLFNLPATAAHAPDQPAAIAAKAGSLMQLAGWLKSEPLSREPHQRIVTHLDYGPEILYRTGIEVVGSPYHRNADGVLFTYDLMNRSDPDEARLDVDKRGVTLILIDGSPAEAGFYNQSGNNNSFYRQLLDKKIPAWLSEIPLPPGLQVGYHLFRVKKP